MKVKMLFSTALVFLVPALAMTGMKMQLGMNNMRRREAHMDAQGVLEPHVRHWENDVPGEYEAKNAGPKSFEMMRFSIDLSLTKLGSSHRRVDSSGVLQAPGTRGFTYGEDSLGIGDQGSDIAKRESALFNKQCMDRQIMDYTRYINNCENVSFELFDSFWVLNDRKPLTYIAYDDRKEEVVVPVEKAEAEEAWCTLHVTESSLMAPHNFYRCKFNKSRNKCQLVKKKKDQICGIFNSNLRRRMELAKASNKVETSGRMLEYFSTNDVY
eukprot:g4149.t1